MYCKNCGCEIEENQELCPKCGNKVDINSNLSVTKTMPKLSNKKIIITVISVTSVILITIFTIISNLPKHEENINDLDESKTTQTISETAQSTTTEEHKLSDDCTYILSTGYDNDDYYELVANQTEDYSGAKIEIGVIKNNKWLVNMSSEIPFVNGEGLLKNGKGLDESKQCFGYLGQGVFAFSYEHRKEASNYLYETLDVIYNSENGKYYDNYEQYGSHSQFSLLKYREIDSVGDYKYNFINPKGDYVIINYSSEVDYKTHFYNVTLLNIISMETKDLKLDFQKYVDDYDNTPYLYPLSNGIIMMVGNNLVTGYDYSGKKAFQNEYNIEGIIQSADDFRPQYGDNIFIMQDGKCTFTIKNNNGTLYDITIDATGNVINQKKIG